MAIPALLHVIPAPAASLHAIPASLHEHSLVIERYNNCLEYENYALRLRTDVQNCMNDTSLSSQQKVICKDIYETEFELARQRAASLSAEHEMEISMERDDIVRLSGGRLPSEGPLLARYNQLGIQLEQTQQRTDNYIHEMHLA